MRCRRSDGASHTFHGALGQALQRGVSKIEDAERLRFQLRRAANRLREELPHQALSLGLGRLLGALTAGLAPDIRESINALRRELRAETPEGLADRLEQAAGTAVLDSFCALAGEVVAFADGEGLTLCIDNGERLGREGAELLLDLADDPPAGVRIVVAIRDDIPEGDAVLERLRAAGESVRPHILGPVRAEELVEAVPDLGLPEARVLLERAGDQPISLGGQLRVPLRSVVSHQDRIRGLLAMLEPEIGEAIRCLALFAERPGEETLKALLGERLYQVELELLSEGLLETRAGELPWMHEVNRAAILGELGENLGRYAATALEALQAELEHSDEQLLTAYELAHFAGEGLEDEPASVLGLGPNALGIFAAYLELSAPEQSVLRFAELSRYGAAQWFVESSSAGLNELLDVGIATEIPAEGRALELQLNPSNSLSVALVRARLFKEHGRAPLPHLAQMLVAYGLPELTSRASEIKTMIGPTSIARLAELESNLRSQRERAPTLVFSADFRGVSLGVAARFDDESVRDRLVKRLEKRAKPLFGKALLLGKALPTPFNVQPARRWSVATKRLGVEPNQEYPSEIDYQERVVARLQAVTRLAECLSPGERAAAELDQPLAIGVYSTDEQHIEIELRGGRVGVFDLSEFAPLLEEGLTVAWIAAEETLLRFGEHLARLSFSLKLPESRHPVAEAIEQIESQMAQFNENQPPLQIGIEHQALGEILERASYDRDRDVEILGELYGKREAAELHNLRFFFTAPSDPDNTRVLMIWIQPVDPKEPRVQIEESASLLAPDGGLFAADFDEMARALDVEPGRIRRVQYTNLRTALSDLLGHRAEDIELI